MSWAAHTAIRTRRKQLGLSQADVAERMGVTKSLLSHIEAGHRQLTPTQVEILSATLQLPPDLLILGSARLPDDVQAAFDGNAADAVAAVRQRIQSEVVLSPQIPELLPLPKGEISDSRRLFLPARIDVRKTSTSYRAHSYHTKVPPEAIIPFIRAFTEPDDIVFDPFCGSGMTGVAALMSNRHALLSDLSPAAVHIARNYTTRCDPQQFALALKRVEQAISPTIRWLYRPVGSDGIVEYTTWSDVYCCPACQAEILYWDLVQRAGTPDGDRLTCPSCGTQTRKALLQWIDERPVQSHTSRGSNRIDAHPVNRAEMALIEEAEKAPIPYWTPEVAFGPEREMWRAGHRAMGIDSVEGFYSRRNFHALSALRHAIVRHSEGRIRDALLFAFTACANRASKRYQWNAKRPTNVMTGTLYVSSLRYEWNVWSLFRRKAADVLRYYADFPETSARADVFQRSATDLDCVPDRSIDMVFMDPPFGSNIFYADSSLLWEAWLGQTMDEAAEIVVNKHRSRAVGGKNVEDYRELMQRSFEQASRVMRVGARAVLAFSNSDDRVWEAVQSALKNAGLDTESTHVLNKGQPSIKGVKGITGKEHVTTFDLVLCLKHARKLSSTAAFPPPPALIDQTVRDALAKGDVRTDSIYSEVLRAVVEAHYSVAGITMPMIAARCREMGATETEGLWRLLPQASLAFPAKDLIAGYLTDPKMLPEGSGSSPVAKPLSNIRAVGGRNSSLYLAHSYHTKVPPEAIAPFIEHYSKPGDVVLDPFCGSGMTGVAAALAGRKAILNDLSPAAIHLAWNHTHSCDPEALASEFNRIERHLAKEFRSLYRTTHTDGSTSLIHWTLWSTRHQCPICSHQFLLWDIMDRSTGRLGKTIYCPRCEKELQRSGLIKLGSEPAWIAYETRDGTRHEKRADPQDIRHALSHSRDSIDAWYPTTPVKADREMYIRCALQLQGIETVADFYTPRNLEALALLWQEISAVSDDRLRRALAFAFTNTAWHGTRMRRFNARGGQRPLTGTLYIPQLSSEANVLEVMRNKIAQLQRYFRSYRPHDIAAPALLLGSATDLSAIPDCSIDYVFTDPPFGSNIFYADCNLIWESWLGRLTDGEKEAVVNRSLGSDHGGKSLEQYAGLIGGAMKEIARVLKPSGWATVVFHNTNAAVWQVIRDAADAAGFRFHEASSLDRRQQSHKGYKGRSGSEDVAHFDVAFNLRKTSSRHSARGRRPAKRTFDLSGLIEDLLEDPEIAVRGLQGVHAEVMRRLASDHSGTFVDYAEVRSIWESLVTKNRPLRRVG